MPDIDYTDNTYNFDKLKLLNSDLGYQIKEVSNKYIGTIAHIEINFNFVQSEKTEAYREWENTWIDWAKKKK